MFDYIISQVRRPFDNAVAALVGRIAVAIPLLVAAIFLISALNNYLHTLWGPVGANLAMAGLFFIIAAIAAMIFASRRDRDASETEAQQEKAAAPARKSDEPGVMQGIADRLAATPHERELVLSIATTALPFIVPRVLKLSLRLLPIWPPGQPAPCGDSPRQDCRHGKHQPSRADAAD